MQDEIPEADVVSDDGGSGDGGDVCEVISPLSFSIYIVCENIEIKTVCNLENNRSFVVLSIDDSFCTGSHVWPWGRDLQPEVCSEQVRVGTTLPGEKIIAKEIWTRRIYIQNNISKISIKGHCVKVKVQFIKVSFRI